MCAPHVPAAQRAPRPLPFCARRAEAGRGLVLTSAGNVLTMFPPLTLDRKTADAADELKPVYIGRQ